MSKATIDKALSNIQKIYGKESVSRLGDKPTVSIPSIPTGIFSLDAAIGCGGLPKGRIIEAFGMEASGKSTLALMAAANAQKLGGTVAYIDMENTLDANYCKVLGVDVDNLIVSQPDSGEQALSIATELITTGEIAMVVVDSVAALVPKAELEGEIGEAFMGLHARLMGQACRKMVGIVAKTGTILFFINQLRSKIGISYGSPNVTTGGNALKFYASVRIDVARISTMKNKSDEPIGSRIRVKIAKNKVGRPFAETELDLMYGQGFSREGDIIDVATELGIIEKSGSHHSYQGEKIGNGRENVKQYLKDSPDLMQRIELDIRNSNKEARGAAIEHD